MLKVDDYILSRNSRQGALISAQACIFPATTHPVMGADDGTVFLTCVVAVDAHVVGVYAAEREREAG